LPAGYDGTRFAPLIVNFHGGAGNADKHDTNTSMSKIASQRGYLVVTPNGLDLPRATWNVEQGSERDADRAFIHDLLAELQTTLCIADTRIFATGHANGGEFASLVVCSEPYEFSAMALVSAGPSQSCPDDVQPALLLVAGSADGGLVLGNRSVGYDGAVLVANAWADHDACGGDPVIKELEAGVQQTAFVDCAKGDVVLLTIVDGRHPWPGSRVAADLDDNSEAGKTFSATNAILDFFEGRLGA
jgi:polyhydroxybutyrate depolymerase